MIIGSACILSAQSISSQHDSYGRSKTILKPKTHYTGTTTVNTGLRSSGTATVHNKVNTPSKTSLMEEEGIHYKHRPNKKQKN